MYFVNPGCLLSRVKRTPSPEPGMSPCDAQETSERNQPTAAYWMAYIDAFASGRLATRTLPMHCSTVSRLWLRKWIWLRRIPLSELDLDSRFSRTIDSRSRWSPGRTAFGSLTSSQPSPARTRSGGCSLLVSEMKIANVWAPDAVSPAKTERAAASSSMWKGRAHIAWRTE